MVIGLSSIFIMVVMTELGSDLWECFLHRLRLARSLVYKARLFHMVGDLGELWQCCQSVMLLLWRLGGRGILCRVARALTPVNLCFVFFQDDSPRVYPTSPGPVPITLAVDHVIVKRRDDGVFYLTGQQHQETCFILPWHPLGCAGGRVLCCAWCWRTLELKCDGCCWEGWALVCEQSLLLFSAVTSTI